MSSKFSSKLDEPAYFKFEVKNNIVQKVNICASFLQKEKLNSSMSSAVDLYTLSSNNSSFAYAMAVEKTRGIEPSKRANYLRVIVDEILRMSSHLFNLGILFHMIKTPSHMAHAMKTRQLVQELQEIFLRSKFDSAISILGGVKYDIDNKNIADIHGIIRLLKSEITKLLDMFENDIAIQKATLGIGVITHDTALEFGLSGPIARASGIHNDVRINSPYAIYKDLEPIVITRDGGDVYSRAMVRSKELKESLRMIEQAMSMLPDGKTMLDSLPESCFSQASSRLEAPRGELFCYVKTHINIQEDTISYRTPTYMNWQVLKHIIPGNEVSNIALIANSIDPCLSFM